MKKRPQKKVSKTPKLPPIPPGWRGGILDKYPQFNYPNPDLSAIPRMGNMAHIPLLKRQQGVRWPEFSWLTEPDKPRKQKNRCFQMFSPFISRIGYTNEGRVYSIICPQQGVWIKDELCLNVEVTVTGVKGWINESRIKNDRVLAANMTVQPRVWFTPGQHQGPKFKEAWDALNYTNKLFGLGLPFSKKDAILINTFEPNNPNNPSFNVRKGESELFANPSFAKHYGERGYYTVGNLGVEIGEIEEKDNDLTNDFNHLVMKAFNLGSGNMLAPNNVLTWNVWFTEPQLVSHCEWQDHAENWRNSIDAHHGPPYNKSEKEEWPHLMAQRPVRYADGSHFNAEENIAEELLDAIYEWLKKHFHI